MMFIIAIMQFQATLSRTSWLLICCVIVSYVMDHKRVSYLLLHPVVWIFVSCHWCLCLYVSYNNLISPCLPRAPPLQFVPVLILPSAWHLSEHDVPILNLVFCLDVFLAVLCSNPLGFCLHSWSLDPHPQCRKEVQWGPSPCHLQVTWNALTGTQKINSQWSYGEAVAGLTSWCWILTSLLANSCTQVNLCNWCTNCLLVKQVLFYTWAFLILRERMGEPHWGTETEGRWRQFSTEAEHPRNIWWLGS
jgi:hypothetical protein